MSQSSTSNQKTVAFNAGMVDVSRQHTFTPRILLVGSLAQKLKPSILSADLADSLIDSFFQTARDTYSLIVVSVSGELQLHHSLAALRKAAPAAQIILLGEPSDELICRRALNSGADDYEIWPISVDKVLRHLPVDRSSPALSHVVKPMNPVVLSVLQMPVQYHAAMADHLFAYRDNIAQLGVSLLQNAIQWPGTLRYDIGEQVPDSTHPSALVTANEVIFGRLVLTPHAAVDDNTLGLLNQAALWLGGWLGLEHRQEHLRSLATTDDLSGARNRHYFTRFISALLEKARVDRFRVSLLLFDIDNFKHYNDTFGHAAGDAIIRELISLLKRCTRQDDLVARLGGDEFAVVFWDHEAPRQPNSQHPTSVKAATERFRKAVCECEWSKCARIKGSVSISGGIATFPWDGDTLDALLEKADQTLLRAKKQGKNVILLSESNKTESNSCESQS